MSQNHLEEEGKGVTGKDGYVSALSALRCVTGSEVADLDLWYK